MTSASSPSLQIAQFWQELSRTEHSFHTVGIADSAGPRQCIVNDASVQPYGIETDLCCANTIMQAGLQIYSSAHTGTASASRPHFVSARHTPAAAAPLTHPLAPAIERGSSSARPQWVCSAVAAPPAAPHHARAAEGHVALQQGLGEVGEVSPALMPWLLRLSHIRSGNSGACGGLKYLQCLF